ncbi:MAG: HAD family hydrolase [Proteobacteria bacterium]|nr:HAD family hydrolase [Pseudomonadota bacterium]
MSPTGPLPKTRSGCAAKVPIIMSNRSSATELSPRASELGRHQLRTRSVRPKLREVAPLAQPRAILFDLDGTLIDTMQVFADVAADVMVRHHQLDRTTARAAYLTTSGIPFFQQLEVIVPGDDRNAAAAAEFEARKIVAVADVVPSPITVEALEAIRALGIAIAVCSNNFQDQVDAFVAHCPVKLDLALGFGNGLAKGPTQFDHACRTFGCRRDDLLFVGDSIADAELARASNIRFVARLGTFDAGAFAAVAPTSPAVVEIPEILALFAY